MSDPSPAAVRPPPLADVIDARSAPARACRPAGKAARPTPLRMFVRETSTGEGGRE